MDKSVDDVNLPGPGEKNWQRRRSAACAFRLRACDVPAEKPNEEVVVEQSHKDSCDINILMARYEKNGTLPLGKDGQPFFGDFSAVPDFRTAQDMVIQASDAFNQLPAKVRSRFGNDPGQLIDFVGDPSNRDEAIKLGLINAPPAPVPAAPAAVSEGKPAS